MLAFLAHSQSLSLQAPGDGLPARVSVPAPASSVVVLESTGDLVGWTEWLRGQGEVREAPDLRDPRPERAFYRAFIRPRTAADDGKNLVGSLADPFLSPEPPPWQPGARWIKFVLRLGEPHRVWFQDSAKYAFHYDYARARLPGFEGMSRAEFDAVTLRTNRQEAVLGAVLIPPTPNIAEYGIQFVGLDPYPREAVAQWFHTVRAMVHTPPQHTALYLPTYEQAGVARDQHDWFAAQGITVSEAGRWVVGDECYAPGWALGRLVFAPAGDIPAAYRDGRLRPEDVLLTDAVPAEVPPLAGIVALLPATPNSHVALLARSFGIPFVHVADAAVADAVRGWTNREVMVRAVEAFIGCDVTIAAVEGPIDPAMRAEILALKAPPALHLPEKAPAGVVSLPAEGLRPGDIERVGGKAANFGVLRRRLPDNSPSPALALTFDPWDAYLDQVLPGGGTLRGRIAARLDGFTWPPDMTALQAALAEVRTWITDAADFNAAQREAILGVLGAAGFDPARKIRFRSSTNVEDSDQFSGAGLYDSYSGCLADDLDGDTAGPSACDPGEPRERGVFRALRKVYASFYNDNAFLERLRHGVDERVVGMAVLIHPSTPDEFEEANGVATLRVSKSGSRYASGDLVTQLGAVSVTNPDSTAVPESVRLGLFGASVDLTLERRSSLVPLGDTVMAWEADYRKLVSLLNAASQGYEAEFPGRTSFQLDFEYKKVAPGGRLLVKQVREVPTPAVRTYVPWMVNTTNHWRVFQGEQGDIIANHRLKSVWSLAVRHTRLGDTDLDTSLLSRVTGEWREGREARGVDAPPAALPGYSFRRESSRLVDRWTQGEGGDRREVALLTERITQRTSREGPLVLLGDHHLEWSVTYATPQPTLGYDPGLNAYGPTTTTQESVRLVPAEPVTAECLRQERVLRRRGVEIRTAFWWPAPPTGPSAGYTAPLVAWVETTVTGLTSRPLVLRSPWAQTYHPGHHNFFEDFAFEPRLDPEVPADLLAELDAANIRTIIASWTVDGLPGGAPWFLWGLDDRFRAY